MKQISNAELAKFLSGFPLYSKIKFSEPFNTDEELNISI